MITESITRFADKRIKAYQAHRPPELWGSPSASSDVLYALEKQGLRGAVRTFYNQQKSLGDKRVPTILRVGATAMASEAYIRAKEGVIPQGIGMYALGVLNWSWPLDALIGKEWADAEGIVTIVYDYGSDRFEVRSSGDFAKTIGGDGVTEPEIYIHPELVGRGTTEGKLFVDVTKQVTKGFIKKETSIDKRSFAINYGGIAPIGDIKEVYKMGILAVLWDRRD